MLSANLLAEYLKSIDYKVSAEQDSSITLSKTTDLYKRQYQISWIDKNVIIQSTLDCVSGDVSTSGIFHVSSMSKIFSECSYKESGSTKFIESRFLAFLTDDNPPQVPVEPTTKPVRPKVGSGESSPQAPVVPTTKPLSSKVGLGESPPRAPVEPASDPTSSEDGNSQQIQQILEKLRNYFVRPEAWYHIHMDRVSKDEAVKDTLAEAVSFDGILTACNTVAQNHDGRTATIFAGLYQSIQQLPKEQQASFVRVFKDDQSKYFASSKSDGTSPTAGF